MVAKTTEVRKSEYIESSELKKVEGNPPHDLQVTPGGAFPRVVGIATILLGLGAMIVPWAAGVSISLVLGFILLIYGSIGFAHGLYSRSSANAILGLMIAGIGLLMFSNPVIGAQTLTLILAGFFLASGLVRLTQFRGGRNNLAIVHGIFSLVAGLLILMMWPSAAVWVLGVLFGIEMMISGVMYLMVSSSA